MSGRETRAEHGFTLIELLVVVLILAILVALAVPAYIHQRKKAVVAQLEVALKDMANFQLSWAIDNHAYADTVAELEQEGFRYSPDVEPTIDPLNVTQTTYCVGARSTRFSNVYGELSSEEAYPVVATDGSDPGVCTY